MPQKKAKPIKAAKSKKPAKPAKSAKSGHAATSVKSGLGAVLKKAAKTVAKSVGIAPAKKVAAKAPAKAPPAKAGKLGKKIAVELPKKALPVLAKGKKDAPVQPVLSLVKGKKEVKGTAKVAPVAKAEGKGKKTAAEVVVVVPAPKGVAILTKDGKNKKGKAAAEHAAAKLRRCREPACDHDFTLLGYCRLHYIKNWRRIKRKESILASGQLNNYVEELVNKYPDKYLDVIRQDLATEKEWGKVVVDLELEGTDDDGGSDEEVDTAAEGVRAPSGGGGGRGEFDDEGDAF